MKIKISVIESKSKRVVVEHVAEVAVDGDLTQAVSVAITEAKKNGIEPFGWSINVDKA